MRRFIFWVALVLFFVPSVLFAASATMIDQTDYSTCFKVSWTSDASGDVTYTLSTDISTDHFINWYLYQVITDPGATAPTDNYDITLTVYGADIAEGNLADRDTSDSEIYIPDSPVQVMDELTVNVSNAGASKEGDIYLFFIRPLGNK